MLLVPGAALGAPILVLIGAWLLIYSPSPLFEINQVSLRQAITADHVQGRMSATVRTVRWIAMPVGSVIGGLLGSLMGVPQTILLGGVNTLLSSIWLLAGPVASLSTHPEPASA